MGKRDRLWKKLWVLALCGVMAMEPAVACAEEPAEAMNAADAQADVSMELPEEVENDIVEEMDEAVAEIPSEAGTESGKTDAEASDIDETAETDTEGSSTGEAVAPYDDSGLEVESVTEVELSPFAVQASNELGGTCGTNVTWSLKDGIMTISGNGAMDDFIIVRDWYTGQLIEEETHRSPWEDYNAQIREVYVEDGVTSVGSIAFCDCYNLEKAVLGNSVKKIGSGAFANDKNLTELSLGKSVESIGDNAFYGIGIKTLVLPSSLKTINYYGLQALQKLENFVTENGGTYQAVDGVLYTANGTTLVAYPCSRNGEYRIPAGVTKIERNAFYQTSLSRIVIPDSVTEIGESAFDYSNDLKTIVFGKGAKVIPSSCCYYDRALTTVIIPEGVTTIKESAFWWCTALEEITLPSTVNVIERAFEKATKVTIQNDNIKQIEDGTYIDGFYVSLTATELYQNAFAVLELVNAERKKAGVPALVMDPGLLDTAMQRSFETALYWSHTRPNGLDCFTANNKMRGENIAAGAPTPESVMDMWMNSDGHRANILSSGFTSLGVGCVYADGGYYWVQCFGTERGTAASAGNYRNTTNTRNILVKREEPYYSAELWLSSDKLAAGDVEEVFVCWNGQPVSGTNAVLVSSDPAVCEVSNGRLIAKKAGTATITLYYEGYREAAVTKTVTVSEKASAGKPSTGKPSAGQAQSKNTYKVNFYPNGGQGGMIVQSVKKKAKLKTLPKVVRSGYQFSGWYTAKTKGKKVSASTKVTKNLKLYARWTKVKVAKPSIKKAVNKKKQKAAITVSKVSGAKGYQLLYADNAKFKNAKTITISKPSTTLKNLQKGKTYYVKARAYKKDSTGKKVFGAYGKSKKVKIRK